jgi:hypothetical protein
VELTCRSIGICMVRSCLWMLMFVDLAVIGYAGCFSDRVETRVGYVGSCTLKLWMMSNKC